MGEQERSVELRAVASPEVMERRGGYRFQPRSLDEAIKISELISTSSIIPQRYYNKPGDILVATGYGAELGLSFLQSLQAVIVQNGTPTIWGDHALGLVKASGLLEWMSETYDPATKTATCEVKRRNESKPTARTISAAQAERAGLLDRTPSWRAYPLRMLQMRARGFALRDTFPDVLRGIYLAEEFDSPENAIAVSRQTDNDTSHPVVASVQPSVSTTDEEIPMPRAIEQTVAVEPVVVEEKEKDKRTSRKRAKSDESAAVEVPSTAEPTESQSVPSEGTPPTREDAPTAPVREDNVTAVSDVMRRIGIVEKVTKRMLGGDAVFTLHFREMVEGKGGGYVGTQEPVFIRTMERNIAEIGHNYRGKVVQITDAPDPAIGRRLLSIALGDK